MSATQATISNASERSSAGTSSWTVALLDSQGGVPLAWLASEGSSTSVARLLFGCEPSSGSIAADLSQQATQDWSSRMRGFGAPAVQGTGEAAYRSQPSASSWLPWSGAVIVELGVAGNETNQAVQMLLMPQLVDAWIGNARDVSPTAASGSQTPVVDLVKGHTLQVNVNLAPSSMDLASLMDLRIGDIVTTAQRLDAPVRIEFDDGGQTSASLLCGGLLGRSSVQRAVALVASR